ncbi:MAG: zinc-binding dehydrogenase [Clostridia bacterium]|nr:zinc-binding dehydrogenase [Clostridia bacterium]
MKAVLVNENKELVWTDVPDPIVSADEVLIEIHATALNRADLLQKQGTYPSPAGWPAWPGLEVAGKIVAMGENAKQKSLFKLGDAVCALVGGGGYAEKIAVPYQLLMPVPKNLTFEEAASLPEAYATSYLNLFYEGQLKAGQVLYVAAGASGLASAAIPIGKAAGAYVVTSVQTLQQAEKIKDLGADYVIIQEKESIPSVFERLEKEDRPVNVCMDCLSGEDLGKAMPYMARGGYWVVISTLAGIETNVKLRPLLTKGLHLVGSMLRNRTNEKKAEILSGLVENVWQYIESGKIKPSVYKVLPIEQVNEAQGILERFENTGKVVLKVK